MPAKPALTTEKSHWTSKPDKYGFYWYRENGKEYLHRVFLSSIRTICLIKIGMYCQEVGKKKKIAIEDMKGEWYGPLNNPFWPNSSCT